MFKLRVKTQKSEQRLLCLNIEISFTLYAIKHFKDDNTSSDPAEHLS